MKYLSLQIVVLSYYILPFTAILLSAQETALITVSVEIAKPLVVEKLSDFSFSTIVLDSEGGTVAFDPDGNIVLTCGLTFLHSGLNPIQASFLVSGRPETGINIQLPQEIVLLHMDGHEMVVDNLVPDSGLNPVLHAQGKLNFLLFSILNVNAGQESGFRLGSFHVTFTYD